MYQQLPVPVDQVLTQQFVQQQPPALPVQLQLPQHEAMQLHATLINAIQKNVQKSYIRTFFFNLASIQQYQNQFYCELLQRASEYYMVSKQHGQVNLEQIVEETIVTEFPALLQQYPILQQYLTQQQQQEMQSIAQHRQKIKQMIQQAMGGGAPNSNMGGNPMGGPPGMQGGGMPGPGGGGFAPTGPAPQGMGGGPMPGSGGYGGPPMGGGMMPNSGYGGMPAGGGRPAPSAYGQGGGGPTGPPSSPMNPSAMLNPQGGGPQVSSSAPPSTSAAAGVKSDRVEVKPNEEPSMFDQKDREIAHQWQKQPEYQPAVASATPGKEQFVYPPAHRSDQYVIAIDEHGQVISPGSDQKPSAYQIEEIMNYEDHETDPELIRLSRSLKVGPKVATSPRWPDVSTPNSISSVNPEKVDEDNNETEPPYKQLNVGDPISLQEPVSAYNVHQAHVQALNDFHNGHIVEMGERVYEYMAHIRTPIPVGQKAHQALNELIGDSPDLVTLRDRVASLHEHVPASVWYMVHDRLTARFNERLKAGAGLLGAEVDSFVEDYNDAMEYVGNKLSREAYDRFRSNARIYLLKSIGVFHDSVSETTFLHEPYYFVHLPWTSEQVDLQINGEYGLLTRSAHEDLQVAAKRLFERTNTPQRSANRRYIVTVDNVFLELHAADLGDSSSLMVTRRYFD